VTRICLGWQFAPGSADPGPPPVRSAGEPATIVEAGWVQAQRQIARDLARPARIGGAACAGAVGLAAAAWLAGLATGALAGSAGLAAAAGMAGCAGSAWRGSCRLAAVLKAERRRVEMVEAARSRDLAAGQAAHASAYRAWQRRSASAERQPRWFAVPLPDGVDRLDVAGGTLAGWSALLTTTAAPALSRGGEVTVLDLTEGAVAGELVRLAERSGLAPLVWVLPADLPRLDLGMGLDPPALADVLALAAGTVGADRPGLGAGAAGQASADLAADCVLLERILGVLGPDPGIAAVTAALRALAEVGDPLADVRSGLLTMGQLDQIGILFGRRAAERVVIERAWVLESRLRGLDGLGTGPVPRASSRLRVAALDRRAAVIRNRTLGTYLVAVLTRMLRAEPPGEPWRHTLFLLGAERLAGDVVDLLADACEASRTGLVVGYRTIPAWVRERLGRGNAAIAFMRLGNGDEARAASEQIGSAHRFVVGQLTDTMGASVTDSWADSYTSTVGWSGSASGSYSASRGSGTSRGRGASRSAWSAPFGDFNRSASRDVSYSAGESVSASVTEGISDGTSWGLSLSRAIGGSLSRGVTVQRSRELLAEPDELQRLPPTAAIISYPAPDGRMVQLVDANPAIMMLPGVDA
jgi:hypothetical protein